MKLAKSGVLFSSSSFYLRGCGWTRASKLPISPTKAKHKKLSSDPQLLVDVSDVSYLSETNDFDLEICSPNLGLNTDLNNAKKV